MKKFNTMRQYLAYKATEARAIGDRITAYYCIQRGKSFTKVCPYIADY